MIQIQNSQSDKVNRQKWTSGLSYYQYMLVKHIRPLITSGRPLYFFGGSNPQGEPPKTKTSKHNPFAIKDLRGHQNIGQLNQTEQSVSPIYSSTSYNRMSAYHFCSLLSNNIARCIGKLVEHPKSSLASDSLHLPKIYPNSVPLHDAVDSVSNFIVINKLITFMFPLSILVLAPAPALTLTFSTLAIYCYNHFIWKLAQHVVSRAELLPQTEEIAYQKITMFGSITTKKVKISDLQSFRIEEQFSDTDASQKGVRGLINKEVAFKIKGSSEMLLFEKSGIWHEQGVNHKLLI